MVNIHVGELRWQQRARVSSINVPHMKAGRIGYSQQALDNQQQQSIGHQTSAEIRLVIIRHLSWANCINTSLPKHVMNALWYNLRNFRLQDEVWEQPETSFWFWWKTFPYIFQPWWIASLQYSLKKLHSFFCALLNFGSLIISCGIMLNIYPCSPRLHH